MKSNLLTLVKIEIAKFFSSFTNGKKATRMPLFYIAILVLLLVAAASAGYSFLIVSPFVSLGIDTTSAVTLFAGITSLLIFMTSMSQARGIYIGDDYDMLSALPLRKRTIVASKIITLYLTELIFSLLVMIPNGIVMIAYAKSVSGLLIALLLSVTLPIVPIAIAIFISLLITLATSRFKYANYIFVVLYTLAIVGFSALSMILNNMKEVDAASGFTSIGNVIKWVNPSYIFVELAITQSNLFFIAYIGSNVIVAILSILFLAVFFDKLHEIVSSVSMKKNYVRKDLKIKSPEKTLFTLEFKRLVNSKLYFMNSIMGSIMSIMGTSVFLITFTQSMAKAKDAASLAAMQAVVIPMFILFASMIIGLANPTTGSINIEGKNFWIIKTLPISYKTYLRNKLRFSFILTIPACLIASTVAVIVKHDNWIEIVASYLLPIIYVILNSLIGMITAINHPKLKWSNETEAVKNSASVVISLIINFGITIILGTILIAIPVALPEYAYVAYIIFGTSCLIPIIPCAIYLNKNFTKKMRAIEDL